MDLILVFYYLLYYQKCWQVGIEGLVGYFVFVEFGVLFNDVLVYFVSFGNCQVEFGGVEYQFGCLQLCVEVFELLYMVVVVDGFV